MPEIHRAALALGSNLPSAVGDSSATLHEALRRLTTLGRLVAVSRFRSTAPVGYLDQPHFINAAALLETTLPPLELLQSMLSIEVALGRDRTAALRNGPRTLDLDLLLYDQVLLQSPELTLPHPRLHVRRFVLEPLAEIAPELQHPLLQRSIRSLLSGLNPATSECSGATEP